jgi:repressor LexA
MVRLPPGQRRVLDAFMALRDFRGISPTVRELCATLGIGPQGVQDHLRALERKGLLNHRPRTVRGWSPTQAAHELQAADTVTVPVYGRSGFLR